MRIRVNKVGSTLLTCGLLFVMASANAKDAFNGSSDLVCATISVVGCLDATNCSRGLASTFDLPQFLDVDFKKKLIHTTYDDGETTADSPIRYQEVNGSQLVLQGVENGHGWTMAVHKDTGRMSISAVGE